MLGRYTFFNAQSGATVDRNGIGVSDMRSWERLDKNKLLLYGIIGSCNLGDVEYGKAVAQAIQGGITCLQVREKDVTQAELLAIIRKVKPLCDAAGVPLIVNDDALVCKLSGAAGVHIGLGDGSIRAAGKLLGSDKIIGATAHNLDEALAAQAAGADYIGVGAAFGSKSKGNAVRLANLKAYRDITSAVDIPVIAIGGINAGNVGELAGLGLSGIAVISAIFGSRDIAASAHELRAAAQALTSSPCAEDNSEEGTETDG